MAGMKTRVPHGSNFLIRSTNRMDSWLALTPGAWKKSTTNRTVGRPSGRLMKKHWRGLLAQATDEKHNSYPSPCDFVGEYPSQKRPCDAGYSVHGADEAGVHRTFCQWHSVRHNNEGPREDSGTAQPCNGTSNDKGRRVRCNATN